MKYCPSCGARYEEAAKFCQHDGTMLRQAEAEAAEQDPYLGRVLLGQFEVEAVIGEGGMGRVYRARQHGFDRPVAIKILHSDLVTNTEMVKRFNREAKIISRLDHPGIIHVYLFGELPDGNLYLAMEFVDGKGLTERMADGPLPVEESVHIARQILGALTEAHRKGVVHRDLKPDNIMLVERPDDPLTVKVLDFGIAKFLGSHTMLTQQGLVFGSARYISPEAAAGETVDERADLYAVGVILYQMLAGRPPFDDSSAVSLLMRHVNDPPPPLLEQPGAEHIPPAVAAVVMQALKKDPSHRFDDAGAMRAALTEAAKVEGVGMLDQDSLGPGRRWTSPPPDEPVSEAAKTVVDEADRGFRTDPMFGAALADQPPPSGAPAPPFPQDRAEASEPEPSGSHGPITQISSKPLKGAKASPEPEPEPAPETPPTQVADSARFETPEPEEPPPEPAPPELAGDDDEVRVPRSRAWIVLVVLLICAIGGGATAALLAGRRGGGEENAPDSGVSTGPIAASVNGAEPHVAPPAAADAGISTPPGPPPPSVEVTAGSKATKSGHVGISPVPLKGSPPVPAPDAGPREAPNPEGDGGAATDEGEEPMPPSATLKVAPRRPAVGRRVRLAAEVAPPSSLRSPRFIIARRGEEPVTVAATPESDASYVAQHTFDRAGDYQVTFVAASDRGELRAFSAVTVAARRRSTKTREPELRDMPDFNKNDNPEKKPPDPDEPSLLPPWSSSDPPPPW